MTKTIGIQMKKMNRSNNSKHQLVKNQRINQILIKQRKQKKNSPEEAMVDLRKARENLFGKKEKNKDRLSPNYTF